MEPNEITLDTQLASAETAISACRKNQAKLTAIHSEIENLQHGHQESRERIQQEYDAALEREIHVAKRNATSVLETSVLDCKTVTQSLKANFEQTSQRINSHLSEELARLEEQRNSETWILQSVLDEEAEDSPITQFEREAETFVTQKAFLDERFETVAGQLELGQAYLTNCHAAADKEPSPPDVEAGNRMTMQDTAVAEADAALSTLGELEKLHLPHWVKGFRLWGFSLLAFVLIWIPVVAVKADLLRFINPELSKPDWQWAGVSAVIALATVFIGALTVLLTAQNRLRSRFQSAVQHLSNAEHARAIWETKSQKRIDKLDELALKWRREVEGNRLKKTKRINDEIDSRILALKTDCESQRHRLREEFTAKTQQCETQRVATETQVYSQQEGQLQDARNRHAENLAKALAVAEREFESAVAAQLENATQLLQTWNGSVSELRSLSQASNAVAAMTRNWPTGQWALPESMPECLSVGDLLITAAKPPSSIDDATPANLCVEMPAVLRFPQDAAILVKHDSAGRETALSFLRAQLLKLLTVIPAGRIRLTLIDPVGLGQSFAAMMHLADFDELLIGTRIWTDATQIRDQLQRVTEHMENIFQTYLRSQFHSIEEYNASAGEVAEPYHFVVVAGFPTAFTEESARHLSSILTSGSRCGVRALVAWNPSISSPPTFDDDDLINNCSKFVVKGDAVQPMCELPRDLLFEQYEEPAAEKYVQLVREAGEQSKDARRVEVSFSRISPRVDEIWANSSADGIDLPIGRAGAARLQYMRLGRGTSQHVLIAGKTGSGKSTFLHILITNLAMHYSPDEIQFYLIDFKKGVEFRTYAANKLPHARVVAIESDREFGLSVLERLDEILQERGELFRDRGVQDVPSFREQFPNEKMPRLMLLIDEFQEFFVAEDRVSTRASLLLDRLVRQGRAFGIHVLLGSQTLGGAYSLARSTMGQIAVRIALQCSENDAHLILSEDNSAARLLTRPGEAIYNDANGMTQGNHQFQIAWLDESKREEAIGTMQERSAEHDDYRMIVFDGNVAPSVELCAPMNTAIVGTVDSTRSTSDTITLWLGEPVAIAAPSNIELRRASGQNLLIVGQDATTVDSILACSILSAGWRPNELVTDDGFEIAMLQDGRDVESVERFQSLQRRTQLASFAVHQSADCDDLIERFYNEVVSREEDSERAAGREKLLIIRNLGQYRSLRKEEDDFGMGSFGEAKQLTIANRFNEILKRGSLVGIHVIVWSDTFSSAVRWLSNSILREFENRIAFRMNQTDSASLVDSPVAASLGQGRALVYRDQLGTTEKFRPFAWPSEQWMVETGNLVDDRTNGLDLDSLTIE